MNTLELLNHYVLVLILDRDNLSSVAFVLKCLQARLDGLTCLTLGKPLEAF